MEALFACLAPLSFSGMFLMPRSILTEISSVILVALKSNRILPLNAQDYYSVFKALSPFPFRLSIEEKVQFHKKKPYKTGIFPQRDRKKYRLSHSLTQPDNAKVAGLDLISAVMILSVSYLDLRTDCRVNHQSVPGRTIHARHSPVYQTHNALD